MRHVSLQVTEGPDTGKLALLDFGLVAEIPPQDRAAMVSATIHLVSHSDGLGFVLLQSLLA
jgi:predicted unusual protein kinase regulating ubiquinone biosynthesis (AarF/ABC1/UbiB family)